MRHAALKVFDHEVLQKAAVKLEALDVPPTTEASQKAAVRLCNSETYPMRGEGPLISADKGV
jgi:hypothetical protein